VTAVTTDLWTEHLERHWSIKAELHPLDGEYGLNFLARGGDGRAVILKVMRPGCETGLVDMQVRALEHLGRRAPGLPFPRVVRGPEGAPFVELEDRNGDARLVWVLTKLPGHCYARVAAKSMDLIRYVGATLGRSAWELADFEHETLARGFKWNLMQASWIDAELACIIDPERRALIAEIARKFTHIEPALSTLPQQAVHKDANDYNILVDGTMGQPLVVSGLINLGDMCTAPQICGLAIAAA